MAEESKNPEHLAAQIFGRTMSAWNAVHTFRWMGQLGLPHAMNQAAWQHERTTHHFATAAEYADMFIVLLCHFLIRHSLLLPQTAGTSGQRFDQSDGKLTADACD
jgi:hypothetical protein